MYKILWREQFLGGSQESGIVAFISYKVDRLYQRRKYRTTKGGLEKYE